MKMSSLATIESSVLATASTFLSSRRLWLAVAAIAIGLLPIFFSGSYWRTNLIICSVNVLLAIGLDFVLGYAGQLNLGQSAFAGIGAYASTLLITKLGVPFWIAFACGVLLAGIAGMLLSIFAVRLRGHYLAIASLGFAVITYQVLLNWISLTQGPLGIYGIAPPPPLTIPGLPSISFSNTANLFYLTGGFALLTYILLDQLVLALSPSERLWPRYAKMKSSAASLGINCQKWKVICLCCQFLAVAGAGGCFYASFVGTLGPVAFFIPASFSRLSMVIVGGMGTLIGTVVGAIPADGASRTATRHRRPPPDRIRRLHHASRAVHARGHRASCPSHRSAASPTLR